ncbi:MAG: TetR/AcrR family transcriptional regulator, partial [Alphaproteobacteria bacterium]|nr:TetR/AcrR family transcriptional regulator [Alphaproteobacteria bacterium]
AEQNLPTPEEVPFSEREIELAWGLHGGVFYIAIRKWIYDFDIPEEIDGVLEATVESFVQGAPTVMRKLLQDDRTGD